ncbi:MAG: hypothetical protein IE928_02220 [Gammaproteobacteria bacterium]|nr:hypothetical protein [Gammaproteobacteria bacterium]
MKRILLGLISVLILGFASLWLLLFTSTGNGILKPWLESYLQGYVPDVKLEAFSLRPEQTRFTLSLKQNARLEIDATSNLWQQSALGTWRLHATDLSELNTLLPLALGGAMSSEGRFNIAPDTLDVDGKLQFPHSLLNFHAQQASASTPIQAQLSGDLALTDLWTLLAQPKLASGTLSVATSADIPRQEPLKLGAQVKLTVPDGVAYHQAINQLSELQLPQDQPFSLSSHSDIVSGHSLSKLQVSSPLAQIQLSDLRYVLGSDDISTQHEMQVNDLARLVFLTKTPLHGTLTATGDAQLNLKTKALTATVNSDTLGGRINAKLANQQLTATLQDLSAVELSRLLGMKPVFKSRLEGQINYHIAQQQGTFSALLSDGQILPNDVSALLNQAARFDVTREVYKTVTTQGHIQQKVITADLDMQSQLTHINSQGARIDLSQQQLDMLINVAIQGLKLPVHLKGDLTSPSVSADFASLLQQNFKQNLQQNAEKAAREAIEKEKEKLQQQFKLPKLF